MNTQLLRAAVSLLLAAMALIAGTAIGYRHGCNETANEWAARVQRERADAAEQARRDEHKQQEVANVALREQNNELARVGAGLRRDIEWLRRRPERPADPPEAPRAACAGATGAELSRADAEFLAGEAARGDECRAGLAACYRVLDAIQ